MVETKLLFGFIPQNDIPFIWLRRKSIVHLNLPLLFVKGIQIQLIYHYTKQRPNHT